MDARKRNRKQLVFYLQVSDTSSEKSLGHVVDISTAGLKLVCNTALAVDKEYSLNIVLPEEMGSQRELTICTRAVWWRQDVNPDLYVVGFEFVNVDDASVKTIEELMEAFGFNE